MGKIAASRPVRLLMVAALCLSLWSCGLFNPGPPRSVVATALSQKAAHTQTLLYQQLALPDEDVTPPQVSGVRITGHHWITLNDQPVVEVEGIYRLKGGGLTRSQQRQSRDFSLYLQRGETQDDWLLVNPAA